MVVRLGLNKRKSDYQPKVRSPHNIALVRDLDLTDTMIEFDVKSTRDTGNHRDCCVFFQYKDPEHFYYVHLGAKPDPHSGQIMIVNGAPRRALTKNKNLDSMGRSMASCEGGAEYKKWKDSSLL